MEQFIHCTQCELCTTPEIISNEAVSANVTKLAIYNESPKSEKRKTFSTKLELHLKVLPDIDLNALRSRILKSITFALKEEFGSDFISVQIISFEVIGTGDPGIARTNIARTNIARTSPSLIYFRWYWSLGSLRIPDRNK